MDIHILSPSGAEEENKNTPFKKGLDLPIYRKQQHNQPKNLAKHLPKTNAVLNQSSIKFVGHRKVLQRTKSLTNPI